MTEADQGGEPKPEQRSVWHELKSAGLQQVAWLAVGIFVVYLLLIAFLPVSVRTLGPFGDSFGALTSLFNALAFAALVATVVLQGRELRESRIELAKQARAQEAWANAAARQIELTKQLEAVRLQPFIKMEWHPHDRQRRMSELRVRNVGLGVAVIQSFELWAREQPFGTVEANGTAQAFKFWQACIHHAIGADASKAIIETLQFDDLNRALAPGEFQVVIYVTFQDPESIAIRRLHEMRRHFQPFIHFYGADGQRYSSQNQFDSVRGKQVFTI